MSGGSPNDERDWKGFGILLLKMAVYLAGLTLFGFAVFWLRRHFLGQ